MLRQVAIGLVTKKLIEFNGDQVVESGVGHCGLDGRVVELENGSVGFRVGLRLAGILQSQLVVLYDVVLQPLIIPSVPVLLFIACSCCAITDFPFVCVVIVVFDLGQKRSPYGSFGIGGEEGFLYLLVTQLNLPLAFVVKRVQLHFVVVFVETIFHLLKHGSHLLGRALGKCG